MKIKNLTKSPYDLLDKDCKTVRLAPGETIEFEPHPQYLAQYQAMPCFEVIAGEQKKRGGKK